MNDSTFTRAQADYDAMEPPEPRFEGETLVLRAVVWLTYEPHDAQSEEEMIDEVMPPSNAERYIARALDGMSRRAGVTATYGLEYRPDQIEVVDAQYFTAGEADDYNPEHDAYQRGFAAAERIGRRP